LGHSGSDASAGPTRWLADAAHLAAAATWSGALVLIVIVSVPQLRAGSASGAAGRAVLRGFGIPAATCVSIMVVTGIYLASKVVGSVDAALFTIYGRTLVLKLAVVCVAGLLALINTMALHRRGARPTPRTTVFAEGVLAVAILALAAVLTSGQPAREPQFVATGSPATVPFVDATVVDLQESLAVRPNHPGRNVVVVDVLDTRRPAPAPVRRVLLNTVDAGGVAAAPIAAVRLADGRWSAAMTLESSGRTYVRITVQRAGLADVRHDFAWNVGGGASPTRSTVVSTAPLAVPLRTLALLVALLLALAWGGFWCRRAARGRPHAALTARPAADHPDIAADSGIAADLVTASQPAGR
jgi:copper transport protein